MVVHACNPRALQVEAGGSGICCIVTYGSPFTIKKKSAEVTLIPKFEDCLPYENIEPRTRWYRPYSYVLGEFPTDYSDESRVRFICGIGAWILFKCAALYSPRAAQQTQSQIEWLKCILPVTQSAAESGIWRPLSAGRRYVGCHLEVSCNCPLNSPHVAAHLPHRQLSSSSEHPKRGIARGQNRTAFVFCNLFQNLRGIHVHWSRFVEAATKPHYI